MNHVEKAGDLFKSGYNCAQAVLGAFEDVTGLDGVTAQRLASSFGGGMGRLREVCGAVSGMFMVAGLVAGYDSESAPEAKNEHYALIRRLAASFNEKAGAIRCADLLGLEKPEIGDESKIVSTAGRKKRPCGELVMIAAGILDEWLAQK